MTKVLMIHPDKCTGCHNCTLACSFGHESQFRPAATRIHVYTWEREGFSVPMMCQQCDEASCMKVCPTGALSRQKGTAMVEYDRAKCIGCRMCTLACPFGNAVYDGATGAILKCDQCGGDPQCAAFCPTQAIEHLPAETVNLQRKRNFAAKMAKALEEVKD